MSLGNTTLWGDLLPGSTDDTEDAGGIDTTQVIDEALWSLHAASRADLTYWTEGDLIRYLDESLKRLARKACVFVGRSTAISTAAGTATYAHPDRHLVTLHVSYDGGAIAPGNVAELEARDEDFRTTGGAPTAWYEDLLAGDVVGLAPVPTAAATLAQVYAGYPATLDAGRQQTLVGAPAPVRGYLGMCLLAEAYSRAGDSEMPDVAKHCRARMDLFEQLFTTYYGSIT